MFGMTAQATAAFGSSAAAYAGAGGLLVNVTSVALGQELSTYLQVGDVT